MATESARDDRPRKKKKKKKQSSNVPWLWIGIGVGVFLVLLLGVGGLFAWRPWEAGEEKRKVAKNNAPPPEQPQGNNKLGGEVVREPKTLLGNIRARGDQIDRDALMSGFVPLYYAYCDEVKNSNGRNLDSFLRSIKAEPARMVNAVRNKDFLINFRARVSSDDILAYEAEVYDKGYYCIRADKQFRYVSAQDLQTAGLAAP